MFFPGVDAMSKAAWNMGVQIFFPDPAFRSFGSIPQSGHARGHGNSIFNS